MKWTWIHQWGSPKVFYQRSTRCLPWLVISAALLLTAGLVWGVAFTPIESSQGQGNSFRIIYIHVPTAFLAQACYLMMALAGAVGWIWKIKLADVALQQAAPIGAWMAFLALMTGALWGKPTWGTYWIWDARLTSMLILLFLYLGVIALGAAISNRESASKACAVLALVGAVNIPIIKYSVDMWSTLHQKATFTMTSKPQMLAAHWLPLLLSIIGLYCFFGALLLYRMRTEILVRESRSKWAQAEVARLIGGQK